eukprot:COSAG02_NODE_364_length_23758_cov_17.250011_20_plen_65_part_00
MSYFSPHIVHSENWNSPDLVRFCRVPPGLVIENLMLGSTRGKSQIRAKIHEQGWTRCMFMLYCM